MCCLETLIGELKQKTALADRRVSYDDVLENIAVGVGILHFIKEL
jgi:hypothetical protein